MNAPILECEVVALDYESTGTVPGHPAEPWQLGLVVLRSGRVDAGSMFETLLRVDANRPFNPHAPGRHALLRDEIAAAPPPAQVWREVGPRLSGVPLCAHNAATEKKFLRAMAPMHAFGPWIDTLRIARRVWPGLASYALGDLLESLALRPRVDGLCPGRGAHDALYDAVASAILLEHLLSRPGWGGVALGELLSL